MICSLYVFFINNPGPKFTDLKKSAFAMFNMICISNVFFINNLDPIEKEKKIGSSTLILTDSCY
jgi:1,4-dihydroxy-2-naphthoate octaprenyltransferase